MPTGKKLVIWGAGGHAMVVADILRCQGGFEIIGFLDDSNPARWRQAFCGSTILGGQDCLPSLISDGVNTIIIAIGDCAARIKLASIAKAAGFSLATAIHPSATIAADVTIREGSVIAAGAILNPAVRIGANVIINTAASIDHECLIEDGVHISPGAQLGGAVRVCRGAWVAIGATVIPKVCIGERSLVGAGAVVVHDLPADVIAYGVPAKVIRSIESK
jgi:UDP-N-acetylbacillosamine N-acetyltransferase